MPPGFNQPPATAPVCLGNYVSTATKFKVCGPLGGKMQTVEITVKPFSYQWTQEWETGPDKVVTIQTPYFSRSFCPFLKPENVAIYRP